MQAEGQNALQTWSVEALIAYLQEEQKADLSQVY